MNDFKASGGTVPPIILGMLICLMASMAHTIPACAAEPIKIGVLAFRPKPQTQQQWLPLAKVLKQAIPERDFVIEAYTPNELELATATRQLDFVLTNPTHYILLSRRFGLSSPLATLAQDNDGQPISVFGGVIFTRAGQAGINTLADLYGKTVAAVTPDSLGGYQMQAHELIAAGIRLSGDAKLLITGMPQDNVIEAVLAGRADIGFVRTGMLEDMAHEGKLDMAQIKVLNRQNLPGYPFRASTHLYPEWPFAALPHIDEDIARRVTAELYRLENYPSTTHEMQIKGFVVPADYTPVADLLQELRLPPFDKAPDFTWHDVWTQYYQWIASIMVTSGLMLLLGFRLWILNLHLCTERNIVQQQQQKIVENEEMLRSITDNASSIIYIKDLAGKYIFVNRIYEQLFHVTNTNIKGKTDYDIFPHDIANKLTDNDQTVIQSGLSFNAEENVPQDDGTHNYLSVKFPLRKASGEIYAICGISTDITEHKRAEEFLRISEERLRLEVSRMPIGYIIWDKDFRVINWNPAAENIFGFSFDEAKGKHAYETIVPAAARPLIDGIWNRLLVGDTSASSVNENLTKDGRTIVCEWTNTPLKNPDGTVLGVMSMVQDVTARNRAEEELRRYKNHLEEEVQQRTTDLMLARNAAEAANRAKSVFLSNMSHELRTPLNAILGFSTMMRKDPLLSQPQRDNLDIINRSGEHLLTLINDVLEVAKIEAGQMQLENEPFDLGGMVRDVTDMMLVRAREKNLRLLLDQASEFPRYIRGDETRLRQVLINIISNAVKFTREGGVTMRLGLQPHLMPPRLLIEIEDSGIGIKPEDQQRIFEPFVQLEHDATQKGTGLGLTLARQYVQLMGGTLSVESMPGTGSVFRVELPVESASAADVVKPAGMEQGDVAGLAPGQPDYRILIVEDQLENQLLLNQLMKNVGFQVEVAENGAQALGVFQNWHPHLIWMDRRMPVMEGVEATRRIRELPGGKAVKIVAVTASAFKEQRDEMLDAGMDDFVRKPYRFNEIYECLARQLGVKYIYTQSPEDAESVVTLTAEMLAVLPPGLRHKLREALESLKEERITDVIQQVASYDKNLHKTLSRLTERFDYPAILKALQTYQAGDST